MSNSDRFPIQNIQLQSQSQQSIKRHHTARYYAHRVRESFTARVTKFLCAILLSLLLVAGIVSFILWLSLRPHRPRFHLIELGVPGLAQPSGFEDTQITFKLTASNPNQHIGIYYDSMVGSVYYRNQRIGSTPLLRPLYQEPKTTSIVYGTFDAATLTVNSKSWKEFVGDRKGGSVFFRLDITSAIRFKVSTWDSKHHILHVSCDVAVGPNGTILPAWLNKRCPVYFS